MTLTQLDAELRRLLNGAYAVDITVWNHRHTDGRRVLEWSIWDADRAEHYKGPTAEAALAKLLATLDTASDATAAAATLGTVDVEALETGT